LVQGDAAELWVWVAAGLTQEALAERMGTTQPAIARLEGGRVSPSVEALRKCSKGVGKRLRVEMVCGWGQPTSGRGGGVPGGRKRPKKISWNWGFIIKRNISSIFLGFFCFSISFSFFLLFLFLIYYQIIHFNILSIAL